MHCRPLEHLAKYFSIFWLICETKKHGCELCLAWKLIQCLLRSSHQPSLASSHDFQPFRASLLSPKTQWRWHDPMGVPSRKLWLIRDRNKVGWLKWFWGGMERSQVFELHPRLRSQTHRGTVQGHIVTTTHAKKKRSLKGVVIKKMPFPLVLIWKINWKIRISSEV